MTDNANATLELIGRLCEAGQLDRDLPDDVTASFSVADFDSTHRSLVAVNIGEQLSAETTPATV